MMKIYGCLFLLLAVCSASCGKEEKHLDPEKMQRILTDLHFAEAYSMAANPDSVQRKSQRDPDSLAVYYSIVLRHHKVTKTEFDNSLDWYKQHPQELDSVYARMIPVFTAQEAIYQ